MPTHDFLQLYLYFTNSHVTALNIIITSIQGLNVLLPRVLATRNMDTLLSSLCGLLVCILIYCIWKRLQVLNHFKSLNIPGPPPNFFTGNLLEYMRKGPVKCQTDWLNKYGPIIGVYFGVKPVILTSDPELIKLAWIKDFKRFSERSLVIDALGGSIGKTVVESLGVQKGQEWKDTRSILTPTFSTGKIKHMPGNIKSAIDIFVKKASSIKKIDLATSCKALCLDAIFRSTMSLNTDVQTNENNPVLLGLTYGLNHFFIDFAYILALCFPSCIHFLTTYWKLKERIRNILKLPSGEVVEEIAFEVLEQRKKMTDSSRKDMIQLMIDTQKLNEKERGTSKTLKDNEIVANIVDFMIGGLESMGTGLSMIIYHLALNQDLQEQCRKEAIAVLGKGKEINYDNLVNLKLAEQVVKESQRLYPSGNINLTRVAEENAKFKQFEIPKGTCLMSAAIKIHYDPNVWTNPTSFDPHRFSSEDSDKDITTYQAFGLGPRGCIAFRYVFLVLKTIVADILRQVEFKPLPETIKKPEIEFGLFSPRVNNELIVSCNPIEK